MEVAEPATRRGLEPSVDAARRRSFSGPGRARHRGVDWQRDPAHGRGSAGLSSSGPLSVAEQAWATALDDDARRRVRARARDRLHATDTAAERTLAYCLARGSGRGECAGLHRALGDYTRGDASFSERREALERLLDSPEAQGSWLTILDRAQPRELAEVDAVLTSLLDTRLALTPEFAELRLLSALARGDADGARDALRDAGPVLPAHTRLWATLAVQDLAEAPESGPALYELLRDERWRVRYLQGALDWGAEEGAARRGTARVTRLIAGLERASTGDDAAALALLRPLVSAVKPRARQRTCSRTS
ncbi:MAG: hypothetical protein H6713_01375 [Myxococcales bacterium]|nr:hypothetical protein [Myxococcales bacterium]